MHDPAAPHPPARRQWPGRLALGLALALPLASGGLLALALQAEPSTPPAPPVAARDIDRAMRLLQSHDPRGKLPGISRQLDLINRDLDVMAHLAGRRLGEARAATQIHPGWARLQLSLPWQAGPLKGWINVEMQAVERAGMPRIELARVGRLALPGWLVQAALPVLADATGLAPPLALARRLVTQVQFEPGRLSISYAWPDDLQRTLASGLLPAEEQARVAVYTQLLEGLTTGPGAALGGATGAPAAPPARALSMAQLLPPVFTLARQRSADSATAVLENRAALTALALLVNTASLPRRPTAASDAGYNVTLRGRGDTSQHFLLSAALSAEAGPSLANAFGLLKELSDSRGGSGFSFNDLAADRAGTRLGVLAVRDPLGLQTRLAAGVQEGDLMPPVADLPESLTQREFQRRFGGVGGDGYQQLLMDIEARLDRLALHATGQPPARP